MDRFPVEIFHIIFSFACTDDGTAGRALSLVSRWTHAASLPYQLQSLCTNSPAQIIALAHMLERRPDPARQPVRVLTLTRWRTLSHTWNGKDTQRLFIPAAAVDTDTLADGNPERTGEVANAVERVLRAVAHTLEALTLDLPSFVSHPRALVPVPFPALRELHIARLNVAWAQYSDSPPACHLPALTSLQIDASGFAGDVRSAALLKDVPSIAPALENLRLTGVILGTSLIGALRHLVYAADPEGSSVFSSLRVVLTVAPPWDLFAHNAMLEDGFDRALFELKDLMLRDERRRVVLLRDSDA